MARETRNRKYDTTEADAKAEAKRLKHVARCQLYDNEQSKKRKREAEPEQPDRVDTRKVLYFDEKKRKMYQAIEDRAGKKACPLEIWCSPIKFAFYYCNAASKSSGGKVHSWRCKYVLQCNNSLSLAPVEIKWGEFFSEDCCTECFRKRV